MRILAPALLAALATNAAAQQGGEPLSAIDWLSSSVEAAAPPRPPVIDEPGIAEDASSPEIVVTPLDSTEGGAFGLTPPQEAGLPPTLWSASEAETLVALIRAEQVETLPALQDLLVALMLARAEAPVGDGGALALARVDKLLDLGDLDAAQRLLESGDLLDPEAFRRWFDVTLLRGTEAQACAMLREHPSLAPTLMARVFCLARNGDWSAAALTLGTARALGDVVPEDDELLSRFLDSEASTSASGLLPPSRPSPLDYRLREAVGDLMPTSGLPLAFSHADLRSTVAWRAQIEAAERLARRGVLAEEILRDTYMARDPAASGGVWDRAAAVQAVERAIGSGDEGAVAEVLPGAWSAMAGAGLEIPFSRLYGPRLAAMGLTGEAGDIGARAGLLSPAYREVALAHAPLAPREELWIAVASGDVAGVEGIDGPSAAVLAGFAGAEAPPALAEQIEAGRSGEAILRAVAAFHQGLDGDHGAVTDAIATLGALGLDDVARRAALQYLILDPSS